MAGIAKQRSSRPERADHDVALVHFCHPSARELKRVVVGFAREDFDHHNDTFLGRQIFGGDAYFMTESA